MAWAAAGAQGPGRARKNASVPAGGALDISADFPYNTPKPNKKEASPWTLCG